MNLQVAGHGQIQGAPREEQTETGPVRILPMIAALKRGSHRTWQSPQGRSKTCDGVEVMKLGMKPAKLDVSLSHDNDVCVCIYIYS